MSRHFHAARCALLLLVPVLVSGAALAQGVTVTQGVTQYDTYQDARGGPSYSNNLTTLPDDRDLLGPGLALSDPFLERVRPARGYGEIGDTGAGYFEWQADRQRQNSTIDPGCGRPAAYAGCPDETE